MPLILLSTGPAGAFLLGSAFLRSSFLISETPQAVYLK